MSAVVPDGWGGGRWGATPWGGSVSEDLQLTFATAHRENAVRLTFNAAPYFDGLLPPNDASNKRRYSVVAVAGTEGLDSLPVRAVTVLFAEVVVVAGALGALLDLYVDRPFSPFPAEYIVSVNNLLSVQTGLPLDPNFSSFQFHGVQRAHVENTTEGAVPSRDFSNPYSIVGR